MRVIVKLLAFYSLRSTEVSSQLDAPTTAALMKYKPETFAYEAGWTQSHSWGGAEHTNIADARKRTPIF
jgi:hypothetical protein